MHFGKILESVLGLRLSSSSLKVISPFHLEMKNVQNLFLSFPFSSANEKRVFQISAIWLDEKNRKDEWVSMKHIQVFRTLNTIASYSQKKDEFI